MQGLGELYEGMHVPDVGARDQRYSELCGWFSFVLMDVEYLDLE